MTKLVIFLCLLVKRLFESLKCSAQCTHVQSYKSQNFSAYCYHCCGGCCYVSLQNTQM